MTNRVKQPFFAPFRLGGQVFVDLLPVGRIKAVHLKMAQQLINAAVLAFRVVLAIAAEDGAISVDLHIMVDNGINLTAVGASIISEVRYVITKCTGTQVRAVNVYIDSMMVG